MINKKKIIKFGLIEYFLDRIYFAELESLESSFSFNTALPYYLLMGFFYLLGLVIYVVQCPERWKPGHFDILVII